MLLLQDVTTDGAGALSDVCLRVAPGEVYALLDDGSGVVSSVVDLLLGRLRPTRGTVQVGTSSPAHEPLGARRSIGVVSVRGFDGRRSARANAETILALCGQLQPDPHQLDQAFRGASVPDRLFDAPAARLRPRDVIAIWLALATLRKTPTIICHQVGDALGFADARHVANLLREVARRGHAVLITDRDLPFARLASDRRGSLRRGRLVVEATGPAESDSEAIRDRDKR